MGAADTPIVRATEPVRPFEVLDDAECLRLLNSEPVGRLGMTAAALPVVLPVNFILDGRTIVFVTEPGLKLDAARGHVVACFEVDGYDPWDHSGWSVLATGRLSEIDDPERRAKASELPLRPWALSGAQHFVELSIELLSGRRIGHQ